MSASEPPQPPRRLVGFASPPVPVDGMPKGLADFIVRLEEWASDTKDAARNDQLKFWSLKIPAIFAASASGFTGHLPQTLQIAIGTLGGLCVALDGIIRPGTMRNVHQQALYRMRNLQQVVRAKWDVVCLEHKDSDAAAAIILTDAQKQRDEIDAWLNKNETSQPSGNQESDKPRSQGANA